MQTSTHRTRYATLANQSTDFLMTVHCFVTPYTQDGGTALHLTLQEGHVDVVRVLIEANALVNQHAKVVQPICIHVECSYTNNVLLPLALCLSHSFSLYILLLTLSSSPNPPYSFPFLLPLSFLPSLHFSFPPYLCTYLLPFVHPSSLPTSLPRLFYSSFFSYLSFTSLPPLSDEFAFFHPSLPFTLLSPSITVSSPHVYSSGGLTLLVLEVITMLWYTYRMAVHHCIWHHSVVIWQ